jgi:site-specific recombinase XerD
MEAYLRAVADISAYHNHPAAELNNDQIQDFLHYSIQEKQLAWSSCNVLFCGLKKYYREYLGRDESEFSIPPRPRSKQLLMLLSRDEVDRIINAPANLKHRALLTTVYGSGLRVSEVVKLRPEHIESSRMMIRVEQAKGRKDRYTVLSKTGLSLLRDYWRKYRPGEWLFFGRDKNLPLSIGTAQRVYYQAKAKAGSPRAAVFIHCATALPPTCLIREWSCSSSKDGLVTARLKPPAGICIPLLNSSFA